MTFTMSYMPLVWKSHSSTTTSGFALVNYLGVGDIPVHDPAPKGLALGGNVSEAQERFLQIMGITVASIEVMRENVFKFGKCVL